MMGAGHDGTIGSHPSAGVCPARAQNGLPPILAPKDHVGEGGGKEKGGRN